VLAVQQAHSLEQRDSARIGTTPGRPNDSQNGAAAAPCPAYQAGAAPRLVPLELDAPHHLHAAQQRHALSQHGAGSAAAAEAAATIIDRRRRGDGAATTTPTCALLRDAIVLQHVGAGAAGHRPHEPGAPCACDPVAKPSCCPQWSGRECSEVELQQPGSGPSTSRSGSVSLQQIQGTAAPGRAAEAPLCTGAIHHRPPKVAGRLADRPRLGFDEKIAFLRVATSMPSGHRSSSAAASSGYQSSGTDARTEQLAR
jgi:hypothetical protein